MWKEWRIKAELKSELKRAFTLAGIYREYQSYNNTGRVYPVIHAARLLDGRTQYVFTLPDGVDPKLVDKNEYVFKQVFGKNIELDGDLKKFVLDIYHNAMPGKVTYNPAAVRSAVEGVPLPVVCGVDHNGGYVAYNMVEHPHLLIAGETGSGKSTQLRSILTTLINTLPADRLELYLADLKRSEFHLFKNIDHVKSVSVKTDQLQRTLIKLRKELDRRGDLLDKHEVMHVDDLPDRLPYIILAIDEVALLKKEKDIMEIVEEISAIGRALGCFLILSMQRPDAKVLDGKLKVNVTVRMGFKTADKVNSNIIGTQGAEKLDVKGRMILKLIDLQEIQAPYLTDDKAKKLLQPYRVEKQPEEEETVEEEQEEIKLGLIDDD